MDGSSKIITSEASTTSKNITSIVFFKVLQYPFLLLSMMLIPRTMGAETYGVYAHLLSIIAIAISLIEFGTAATFGRYISEYESKGDISSIRKLSTNMLALKFVTELSASVVLFFILYFLYHQQFPVSYFILIIFILITHDLGTIPYSLLFGLNKLGKVAVREPIRRILNLIFILSLFYLFGLFGAIAGYLLVSISLGVLGFYWTRGYFRLDDFRIDLTFLKPYLKFEFLYFFSGIVFTILQKSGNPLIEKFTGSSREVAFFDIPNTIFIILLSFATIIVEALVPIFSKLILSNKEDKIVNWSKLITKYISILCTAIIGAFILAGPDLIPILIGAEYKDIFPNGVVLFLGIFPMIIVQLGVVYGVIYKKLRQYLIALCISFLVFIISSIILIPVYASLGCSIAAFTSYLVLALVMFLYFKDKIFPVFSAFLKAIIPGLIFIPFIFISESLVINLSITVVSVFLYMTLLFFTKTLAVSEVKEIIKAVRYKSPDYISG